jgi:hypothetical protein
LLVITGLLYALRSLHYYGLLKNQGFYAKYKTIFFEKNNFNVLFLGSSRVQMHYDTHLFDSLTKQNSYNLGTPGATTRVAFAVLKAYLEKSHAPAYLIYEIDYPILKDDNKKIMDFNNYFPFLSNKTLRHEFNLIDGRMNQFYYNPYFSWSYTGLKNISTGLHGWLHKVNRADTLFYKGFSKEILRPSLRYSKINPFYSWIHVSNRSYLDSIILLCKRKNIKITLMTSPIFGGGKLGLMNKEQITDQLKNIGKLNQVSYYDLSSLPFFNQRNLFIDEQHLNYAGARKFTLRLGELFNNKILH